jgi:uncharacterized protein YbcI
MEMGYIVMLSLGLNEKEVKELQHEFKIYMQKYFKKMLGRGVDYTKINIFEDMLVIRGEGFLTEPEKFIALTPNGEETIKASRNRVVHQHIIDNIPFFEEKLHCKCIHQTYCVEPEKNFWMHVIVFDHQLTE